MWEYAELSKNAKVAGGPQVFLDSLIEESKKPGKIQGHKEMYPIAILASLFGAVVMWGGMKLIANNKDKEERSKKNIDNLKEKIIISDGNSENDGTGKGDL